jgi:hypothetical protein
MDFTLKKYSELLEALKAYGFEDLTLRHDVDLRPLNSLRTAQMEAEKGLHGIYYFRAVPESWDEGVIKLIAMLGHEIGYHYESLTTCNGDVDKAYEDFCENLEKLRALVSVRSICMHGSPRSPFDSKDIWKKYDYHALGIENEPYLDTDFSQTFYLTDTGRRWDGYKVSVRDKIPEYQDLWSKQGLTFHSTDDVISGIRQGLISKRLMLTVHPQRWNAFGPVWIKEFLLQNAKNVVKHFIVRKKNK